MCSFSLRAWLEGRGLMDKSWKVKVCRRAKVWSMLSPLLQLCPDMSWAASPLVSTLVRQKEKDLTFDLLTAVKLFRDSLETL